MPNDDPYFFFCVIALTPTHLCRGYISDKLQHPCISSFTVLPETMRIDARHTSAPKILDLKACLRDSKRDPDLFVSSWLYESLRDNYNTLGKAKRVTAKLRCVGMRFAAPTKQMYVLTSKSGHRIHRVTSALVTIACRHPPQSQPARGREDIYPAQ